ncbi:MAG: 4-(cytidine 5'-diphospho)-2-C-methyl-D-erythritol kinase [Oscillospiraceae bacterium]|jgi:4-diphosphocytidyl-2-C-methyl-D-erythritol kinase
MEIQTCAYAKLNLSLDVLGKMDNGYHRMKMVMQSVQLWDDVSIALTADGEVKAQSNLPYLPNDERNIAVKAAKAFFAETGMTGAGADIRIFKRIPVASGLGGGSSDGAAVLRGLNALTGAGLSRRQLEKIAEKLGSDVPFCVAGGTVLAEGKGEVLTDLPPMPECHIVICKPAFSLSTPEVFERYDSHKTRCRPDTEGLVKALENGDLRGIAVRMYNVFEDVMPRQYEAIHLIKSQLLNYDALGVTMSGTGSAVFGIFDSIEKAEEAYRELKNEYKDCFLTKPINRLEAV